jgi:hypothetical protein
MNSNIFWELNEAYQLGVCNQVVEEVLTEEEIVDIQEWVEALIEEGYDLDEYSDDELYEAYLEDLDEAKVDTGKRTEQKVADRRRRQGATMNNDYDDSNRQALHRGERGQKNTPRVGHDRMPNTYKREQEYQKGLSPEQKAKRQKENKRSFANFKRGKVSLPEELDLYDIVSEYLVSEGFCESYEDADVIMANMSEEWRQSIGEKWIAPNIQKMDKQSERHRGFTLGLGSDTAYRTGPKGESPSTVAIRRNNRMAAEKQRPTFNKYQPPKPKK